MYRQHLNSWVYYAQLGGPCQKASQMLKSYLIQAKAGKKFDSHGHEMMVKSNVNYHVVHTCSCGANGLFVHKSAARSSFSLGKDCVTFTNKRVCNRRSANKRHCVILHYQIGSIKRRPSHAVLFFHLLLS